MFEYNNDLKCTGAVFQQWEPVISYVKLSDMILYKRKQIQLK